MLELRNRRQAERLAKELESAANSSENENTAAATNEEGGVQDVDEGIGEKDTDSSSEEDVVVQELDENHVETVVDNTDVDLVVSSLEEQQESPLGDAIIQAATAHGTNNHGAQGEGDSLLTTETCGSVDHEPKDDAVAAEQLKGVDYRVILNGQKSSDTDAGRAIEDSIEVISLANQKETIIESRGECPESWVVEKESEPSDTIQVWPIYQ